MNILLFAPALFLAYLATQGFLGTIKQLTICASIQLILAYPFLTTYPWSYIKVNSDQFWW
jgi:alpha-1,3-mannosyltransferase